MGYTLDGELVMTQSAHKETGHTAGREAALRMYPNNSLKRVEGEFESSLRETVLTIFKN